MATADPRLTFSLNWTTLFKLVPELPVLRAYIDRIVARPAVVRAMKKDAELAARLQPAA